MKGAAIFDVARCLFSAQRDFRSFDQLPLAALVVSDVSSHILLHFVRWNTFLDMENLILSLALLGIHVTTHAVVRGLSLLVSNHVSFVPLVVIFILILLEVLSSVMPVVEGTVRGDVLVGNESSIEGSDALKVNGVALDHILDAQREGSTVDT